MRAACCVDVCPCSCLLLQYVRRPPALNVTGPELPFISRHLPADAVMDVCRAYFCLSLPPALLPPLAPPYPVARRVYLLSGYVIARLSHLVRLPFFLHVRAVPLRIYLLSFTTGGTAMTDPAPVQL